MNFKLILDFLRALEQNNNKPWFDAHRDEYQSARALWLEFVQDVLNHLAEKDAAFFQTDPRKCIFRINRDVRFSHNKHPYKTNFGAFFVPGGKNSDNAGYYLHLEPNNCAIAGGVYHPEKDRLEIIRQRLLEKNCALPKLIKNKIFVQYFSDLDRTHSLKKRPNGYDENHARMDLIRLKSFTVWKPVSETQVCDSKFFQTACDHFDVMEDFINWLNQ